MTNIKAGLLGASALAILATSQAPLPAVAQGALEEITVTARKREETLQEIPLAITAFSRDELVARGTRNLIDIAEFSPGIAFEDQGLQQPGRIYSIVRFRGVANDSAEPARQTGSVFLDGIFFPSGVSSLGIENIERVEVVRGPSSALYGRSTFSGAVNFITREPSFEPQGRVAAEIAQYGGYDVSASYEGGIIEDVLAARAFVRAFGTNGQYTSTFDGGDLGEQRTETFMGTVLFTPTSNWSTTVRGLYSEDNDGPAAALLLGGPQSRGGNGPDFFNTFDTRPELEGVVANEFFLGPIPLVNQDLYTESNTALLPGWFDEFFSGQVSSTNGVFDTVDLGNNIAGLGLNRETVAVALSSTYDFEGGFADGHSFDAIIGYTKIDTEFLRDFDETGSFNPYWVSNDVSSNEVISTEFRLSSPQDQRINYLLGVSYLAYNDLGNYSGGNAVLRNDAVFPDGQSFFSGVNSAEVRTLGFFGALGIELTDTLTIDGELRWQRDRVTDIVFQFPERVETLTFKEILPKATLNYKPFDTTNLWFTYSKGYFPGFRDTQALGAQPLAIQQIANRIGNPPTDVEPQFLRNFELGWKQSFYEDRLTFSLVGYWMRWKNVTTRFGAPWCDDPDSVDGVNNCDPGTTRSLNIVQGLGDARLYGVEFEASWIVNENLSFQATYNNVESEYLDLPCPSFELGFIPPGEQDCSGNSPIQFPEQTASLSGTWTDQLVGDWDYFVRTDGIFTGKRYVVFNNQAWLDSYWIANLRFGVEREDIRVEAFVNNLLDNNAYVGGQRWTDFSAGIGLSFGAQAVLLSPANQRTAGLKVIYNF